MAFLAAQRRHELGLRMALGASRGKAAWLVVRDALAMLLLGIAAGLPAVWALRRLVEAQLFGVNGFDAATVVAATAVLALVALAAATLPAWRASRVNPDVLLRTE
jgi:ABC-type antimicrobial peptide transport system permease subunit